MPGSVVITSDTQAEINRKKSEDVWEIVLTWTFDAGDGSNEVKVSIPINGILQKIIATSGTADGISGTFTLAIDDNGDNEIFTAATPATPAEGATSTFNISEPVSGVIDVGVNPNDDPTSGSWTITVTLRGI